MLLKSREHLKIIYFLYYMEVYFQLQGSKYWKILIYKSLSTLLS